MAPSIHFRRPPSWFFKFPPDEQPLALPPPTDARTFASPFGIPTEIYNGALDYKVPITIATLYAATAIVWNRINRERGYKPYSFSQTRAFKAFVIVHNVFLAIFSAFTFWGMMRALAHTWPGREHHFFGKYWPGMRAEYSLAGAADALCKMHGPRGFGEFVAFRPESSLWKAQSATTKLLGEFPDGSDVGRLWNEGLAFWGWWFYLSKFYEVFDTFIILAKGKRSSTLQTYHHTGAMMCMWAGIRYMSPPIWMFCFLNSGIHTMMYVYYTLSALSIRVPQRIKRSLTTMQIGQFLIGITFAGMHLFVTYDIPITRAEAVSKTLESMASSISSGVAEATSAGLAAWLKQAALRAAGEEGLAENVLAPPAQAVLRNTQKAYEGQRESQTYISGYETIPCIDTSGQSFAIWLNLLYLAPLTGLFVRFFVKSYTRRGRARQEPKKDQALKAIQDAAHGTESKVEKVGRAAENSVDEVAKEINGKPANGKSNGTPRSRKVSDTINKQWERFEKGGESLSDSAKSGSKTLGKKVSKGHDKLRRMFEDGSVSERSRSPASQQERGRTGSDASSTVRETVNEAEEYGSEAVEKLENAAEESVKKAKEALGEQPDSGEPKKEETPSSPKQPDELEQSWADVAKDDAYPKQQQPTPAPSEEPEEKPTDAGAQNDGAAEEDQDRAPTPKLEPTRSLSPQKQSKLPRPTSRTRSPEKQAPKQGKKSSSIPRPANNGTKPALSSKASDEKKAAAEEEKEKSAGEVADKAEKAAKGGDSRPSSSGHGKGKDISESTSSLAPPKDDHSAAESASSPSKKKKKRKPKKLETKPKSAESSTLSPLSPTSASDVSSQPPASPTPAPKEKEESQEGTEKKSTNGESTQASADSSSRREVEAGSGKERLQFKHSEGSGEAGGGEVKEGTSFADAVKEDGMEEGDVSID